MDTVTDTHDKEMLVSQYEAEIEVRETEMSLFQCEAEMEDNPLEIKPVVVKQEVEEEVDNQYGTEPYLLYSDCIDEGIQLKSEEEPTQSIGMVAIKDEPTSYMYADLSPPDDEDLSSILKCALKQETCNQSQTQLQRRLKGERQFKHDCVYCQMAFSHPSILKYHLLTLHFICDVCDEKFSKQSNLKEHKLSHVETHTLTCIKCDMMFTQDSELKEHQLTHTVTSPPRLYWFNRKCAFDGCTNTGHLEGVHMFDFPKKTQSKNPKIIKANRERYRLWAEVCGIYVSDSDLDKMQRRHICDVHFESYMFKSALRDCLFPLANPTRNPMSLEFDYDDY